MLSDFSVLAPFLVSVTHCRHVDLLVFVRFSPEYGCWGLGSRSMKVLCDQ